MTTSARLLCIGDLNADITIAASSMVRAGSDTVGSVRLTGGGSAANVAVAATTVGVGSRFVGVVGDDLLGRVLVDELSSEGVDVRAVRRAGASTRAIAALIEPGGERSMVSDLSTATVLTSADIDASWFDDIDWLHLTGYSYFPADGPTLVRRLLQIARDRSISWSFDPSSSEMLRSECADRHLAGDLTGVAVLFPNADEATVMTGAGDPLVAAGDLLDIAECVVVTAGADGAYVARRGVAPFRVPAHPVDIVNTLGCGDAFAGAYIAGRLHGFSDRRCAEVAAAHAAAVASRVSAR